MKDYIGNAAQSIADGKQPRLFDLVATTVEMLVLSRILDAINPEAVKGLHDGFITSACFFWLLLVATKAAHDFYLDRKAQKYTEVRRRKSA